MKRIFLAFLLIFLATPALALADVQDECQDSEAGCFCRTGLGTDDAAVVGSTDECYTFCQGVDGLHGNAIDFQFSLQCFSSTDGSQVVLQQCHFQAVQDGTCDISTDEARALAEPDPDPIIPTLNVEIPGLEFSIPARLGGNIEVNFIGEYVEALYKWLIAAAALIAVIMMMISGLQWMLAAGNATTIGKAKKRIGDAITGLVLILAAYSIAFYIDPDTTRFGALNLEVILKQEFPGPDGENWDFDPRDIPEDSVPIYGDYITDNSNSFLHTDAADALALAGEIFNANTGLTITVAGGSRTMEYQAGLFYDNCLSQPNMTCKIVTCNIAVGTDIISGRSSGYTVFGDLKDAVEAENRSLVASVMAQHGKIGNCPHTSTVAVDAWCPGSGSGLNYDTGCQFQMMQAMAEAGWCRLPEEPWHFEYNPLKLSTGCSLNPTPVYRRHGTSYNPGAGQEGECQRWSYLDNVCID